MPLVFQAFKKPWMGYEVFLGAWWHQLHQDAGVTIQLFGERCRQSGEMALDTEQPCGQRRVTEARAETGQAAVLWRAIHQTYAPTETILGTVLTVTAALYGKGLCHRAMGK